jgi:hypothetical protein
MKHCFFFCFLLVASEVHSQLTPEITSWIINTTGDTGYSGIPSNVQLVQYSANWVYVTATCIPGYDIGPWTGNPNTPSNQNFLYKITRSPVQNTGTPVNTPLGHTGVWSNGVSIYNAKDGMSYNNQNIWNQNAIVVEGISFDSCLGHPAPNGEYHHHLNPLCLYDETDSLNHSPIIGYAFDGFPIYGAYSYSNTNGTGSITRMKSSYQLRNITARTTLPDGTVLSPGQYGPPVSASFPLGYYIEDFEFVQGYGDLDEHNGRFCITPDYPAGIYSYFATLDSALSGAYPYTMGPAYYGTVAPGNTGPGSGHNIISEPVTVYNPTGTMEFLSDKVLFTSFPNPSKEVLYVTVHLQSLNNLEMILMDMQGKPVQHLSFLQPTVTYPVDISSLAPGSYFLKLNRGETNGIKKIVIVK